MAGALGKIVPLILLFVFIGIFGWVGYQMYVFSNDLADRGKRHMQKKHNISFTNDGMRVGVKGKSEEEYADKQQDYLVKTWNLSGKQLPQDGARPSSGRSDSSSGRPSGSRTTSSTAKAR